MLLKILHCLKDTAVNEFKLLDLFKGFYCEVEGMHFLLEISSSMIQEGLHRTISAVTHNFSSRICFIFKPVHFKVGVWVSVHSNGRYTVSPISVKKQTNQET